VSSAVQEVPQAVPAATPIARPSPAPAFEVGGAPPAPACKHRILPRETSSPILVSAGYALFLLTMMGVIALRLSVAPVEARRVEIEVAAPAAVEPSPVAIETEPPRPVPVLPVVEEERADPLVLAAVAPVAAERVAEAESAAETRAIPEELTWSAVEAAPVPSREPRAAAQLEPEAELQLDPKATQPRLEPDPLPAVSAAIESTEPAPPAEPEVATSVERETREAERRRRERQRLMQQIQRQR
jgi:hypothetical protein